MRRNTNRVWGALFLVFMIAGEGLAWQPANGPLATRWARDVSPTNAWPEYPRPQMVRDNWQNLNGLWQYAVRSSAEKQPEQWDGEILVPFAVESMLSGVRRAVTPEQRLWYRRTFSTPPREKEGRLLLHFGAVDWECHVWVNGQEVGRHTGGYDPFTFDITDAVTKSRGQNELVVAVMDPTDTGSQPRGKQVLKPQGIFYTAVTGIWQTVWLESVPKQYIRALTIVPDVDASQLTVRVDSSTPGPIRVHVVDGGKTIASNDANHSDTIRIDIPQAKTWSPDSPFLYDVKVELLADGKVVDSVTSYCGMRKIEVRKDADGRNRLWLNGKVLFQYGPLDQGWWPDGLYTAPTDAALKYDIEMTKRLGMNLARKHVKVEPERWYCWCDKLGLLVWQDMPSGDANRNAESKANYRRELKAMIDARRNHPSIVMWVPFNEGWGQYDTPEVAGWVQQYDASRPVNEASGWDDKGSGDVSDMHNYPGPGMRTLEPRRVCVLGEFGGLGMPVSGHTWQAEKNWGYVSYTSARELTDAYVDLLTMMRPLIQQGLSAAVYTQTTDCEIEVNGLMTYDRDRVKMDESRMVEAAKKLYLPPPKLKALMPTSEKAPQSWRFTMTKPGEGWERTDFDDSRWKEGPGGFGTKGTPGTVVRTEWNTPDVWLRRSFDVSQLPSEGQLMLLAHHDEDAEIYLNGTLIRTFKGYTQNYGPVMLDHSADKQVQQGNNTIAVHCHQTGGGQYIDLGLSEVIEQLK